MIGRVFLQLLLFFFELIVELILLGGQLPAFCLNCLLIGLGPLRRFNVARQHVGIGADDAAHIVQIGKGFADIVASKQKLYVAVVAHHVHGAHPLTHGLFFGLQLRLGLKVIGRLVSQFLIGGVHLRPKGANFVIELGNGFRQRDEIRICTDWNARYCKK